MKKKTNNTRLTLYHNTAKQLKNDPNLVFGQHDNEHQKYLQSQLDDNHHGSIELHLLALHPCEKKLH